MRISELSKRSGASQKALRLYESKNLLPPVPRNGNYRDYQAIHLEQVLLIRKAQNLGFKLQELQAIHQNPNSGFNWPELLKMLKLKRQQIHQKQKELAHSAFTLNALISELEGCPQAFGKLTHCDDVAP